MTLCGIDRLAGTYTLAPLGGAKSMGAVLDGAWMHPALLEKMVAEGYSGLQVLHRARTRWTIGRTTRCPWSATAPAATSRGRGTARPGVLLVSSSRQDGAFSPFSAPGEGAPQANSIIGYRQLVGVRQRDHARPRHGRARLGGQHRPA